MAVVNSYDHLMEQIKATREDIRYYRKPLSDKLTRLETQQRDVEPLFDTGRVECFRNAYRVLLGGGKLPSDMLI